MALRRQRGSSAVHLEAQESMVEPDRLPSERWEVNQRDKLAQYSSVDDAANLIKCSKRIIVITGAGICTSLDISDFRSEGTGLYSTLAEEVFYLRVFKKDPSIFYSAADRYTPTHAFIALLHDKLLTNYTQNIDNIEAFAGIPSHKLIQCHGSLEEATCLTCKKVWPMKQFLESTTEGVRSPCLGCKGEGGSPRRGYRDW